MSGRPGYHVPSLLIFLALAAGAMGVEAFQEQGFPHEEHAGLFPLCTGCHQGVPEGDSAAFYPDAAVCVNCHDGGELDRVAWEESTRVPGNLTFAHREHAAAAEEARACADCHTEEGAARMAVRPPLPARCMSCHAHEAESHYVDAECSTCHRPLAHSPGTLAWIDSLPRPDSHDRRGFLAEGHGRAASAGVESCSTCHTQERCTSCHVDAERVEAIAALPRAPEDAGLPAFEARYPEPESHRDEEWIRTHGERAAVADCSTCHTRQSCTGCHQSDRPQVVAKLADRDQSQAPGVEVSREAPSSHVSPFWTTEHGSAASTGSGSCTTCHTEATCTSCHTAERERAFHPPDFLAQHASQAYGRRLECSNCHNTAVFCRECHQQLGMESRGRLDEGFHDGQPLWLLRHGQAARQGLESCASCHRQTDCLQCHSQQGAFKVNPHGDMDLERYADRNREVCFACHLDDPLQETAP